MSFEFDVSEKDIAAVGYMRQVHMALVKAAIEAKKTDKLTQQTVADLLGVDKSAISRILSGRGNPTARTIGELAWALGFSPRLEMDSQRADVKQNIAAVPVRPAIELSTNNVKPVSHQANTAAFGAPTVSIAAE